MEITHIGGPAGSVITCLAKTDAESARKFSCVGPTDASIKNIFDMGTISENEVKVPFVYKGTETAQFRCEVTVDDADSAVMIYAEALRLRAVFGASETFKFYNGERYLIHGDLSNEVFLKLQVYGDNAEPVIVDISDPTKLMKHKLEIAVDELEIKNIKTGATLSLENPLLYEETTMSITYDKINGVPNFVTSDTYQVMLKTIKIINIADASLFVEIDMATEVVFRIYPECAAGKYYNMEAKECTVCDSGYRSGGADQFQGCQACPSLKCPNSDRTVCLDRDEKQISLGGWSCSSCPGGTERNEAKNMCDACTKGTSSQDGAKCYKCNESGKTDCITACETACGNLDQGNQATCISGCITTPQCEKRGQRFYAPSAGFSQCLECNGFVKEDQCTPCPPGKGADAQGICQECQVGEYSPNGACLSCSRGSYQPDPGQSTCRPCPEGYHTNMEKQISCLPCQVTDKKYTHYTDADKTGAVGCKEVVAGNFLMDKVGDNDEKLGIEMRECDIGKYRAATDDTVTECKACDHTNGEFQTNTGQDRCQVVSDGYYLTDPSTAPKPCPAGSYRHTTTGSFVKCQLCEAALGQYQDLSGQGTCKTVIEGYYIITQGLPANTGPTDTMECAAGSARSNSGRKYTECEPCTGSLYQPARGKASCDNVPQGEISKDGITTEACPAGTRQKGNKCRKCQAQYGEYTKVAGMTHCNIAKPGRSLTSNTEEPQPCPEGHYGTSIFTCEPCNADKGEYQDMRGSPFCKIVEPGYQLNTDKPSESPPIKCPIGTFSKGSSKTCTKCDFIKKEYQNDEGSTYCKICAKGEVNQEGTHCKGINCKKEKIVKREIRKAPFVFSETASEEYLTIPCSDRGGGNHNERITRYCKFNLDDNTASWGPPDFSKCATRKTAQLKAVQKKLTELSYSAETLEPDDLVNLVNSVAQQMDHTMSDNDPGADSGDPNEDSQNKRSTVIHLTSRDVTDVVRTFDSMTNIFDMKEQVLVEKDDKELQKMSKEEKRKYKENLEKKKVEIAKVKTAKKALKNSMVKSISKVAVSGEDTLKTVNNDKKKQIVDAVESLADSMEAGEEPLVTNTLAVETLTMPTQDGDETSVTEVELPVPTGMNKTDAPKLELGAAGTTGASVAVFAEDARDIFPDPAEAIDSDLEENRGEESLSEERPRANRTLNSCIVSLKFKKSSSEENKFKSFTLKIKANVTDDAKHKSDKKQLMRSCTFLNTTTTKWSRAGCTTQGPDQHGHITCTCDHNTSFAILLSVSDIVDNSQEQATIVMFYINIAFLFLTFLAIAPFKKYRKKNLMVLQTQLVFSLIVANISFHVLSKTTKIYLDEYKRPLFDLNKECIIGVIVVQYLFLCVMAWMTCCAYTLYGKIVNAVKTFGKQDKYYVVKCLIGCWVTPLLFPLSGYLTAALMNDFSRESKMFWSVPYIGGSGMNQTDCWVDAPWKWISFMLPCYICLIFNSVIFFMIGKVLFRAMKRKVGNSGFGKQIKGLITIAITVGLPWIVGVMTFEPMALIGQWLFIILTGLQGPVMFATFVVLQEEVLSTLLTPLGLTVPEVLQSPRSTTGSSTRRGSNMSTSISVFEREPKKDPMDGLEKIKESVEEENVYCNEAATDSGSTTNDNAQLVKSEGLTAGENTDHTYYECTHFPYDADVASLASQFPEPISNDQDTGST